MGKNIQLSVIPHVSATFDPLGLKTFPFFLPWYYQQLKNLNFGANYQF
jgi:hypothetical protein